MQRFLIVCGAGGVGCGLRYLISLWAGQRFGTGFPYGTLIVNVLGSLAFAFVLELSLRVSDFSPNLRIALTTGFLGGFTTYSSFNFETTTLMTGGQIARGMLNLGITLVACFGAGLLGFVLARRIG